MARRRWFGYGRVNFVTKSECHKRLLKWAKMRVEVAVKKFVAGAVIGMALATASGAAADDIMVTKAPPPSSIPADFSWTGFYVGSHQGYAWGSSNWTAPPNLSGSLNLFQPFNAFNEAGSFSAGTNRNRSPLGHNPKDARRSMGDRAFSPGDGAYGYGQHAPVA